MQHTLAEYLAYADRVWTGQASLMEHLSGGWRDLGLIPVGERTRLFTGFANVAVFDTGEGLVMVDSGEWRSAGELHAAVRKYSSAPLTTVVFTHGHLDHVFGVHPFDAEADEHGTRRPEVFAHEAVLGRFDRYTRTAGYNGAINRRQFKQSRLTWPTDYRAPDVTYRDTLTLHRGELTFELVHARGETDDATYVWIPELRTLCTGDLFIWSSPNAGNPQKVQRYAEDWARALRQMAELGAETLLPGHGVPILGPHRVREALGNTAAYLEALVEQTLELMNAGATLDQVLHTVTPPCELVELPYLKPSYDEPEFVVRNLWRLYGGWYDQNPAHLKPAPEAELAAEVATLSGGAQALADRARQLLAGGSDRIAAQLVEWAAQADPSDATIAAARAEIYEHRARQATSTMAKGVFSWAASESRAKASGRGLLDVLADWPTGERESMGARITRTGA